MPLEGTRPLSRLKGKNSVTAQVVPQKAACGRARDRKANFSSANSPTDRLSEGVPGHHRGVPGQLPPKNDISRSFRDAVLLLAKDYAFARTLVNSGRLSVPATLAHSPLNTLDQDGFDGLMVPGAPSCDAPVRASGEESWFLEHVGDGFTGIYFSDGGELSDMQLAA